MSTAASERQYTDSQRSEAAEWFVAIRETEGPSEQTLQSWLRWLEASDGNRLAFEAVERAWQQTSGGLGVAMPEARELKDDEYDGTASVAQWRATSRYRLRKPNARSRWFVPAGLAAALAFVFFAKSMLDRVSRPVSAFSSTYATGTAEHLEVALPDGSRVSLGAKSGIAVDFTAQRRTIRLTGGEAFFVVSRDAVRPFAVHALNGTITALGTAFNVRTASGRVMVAVTEGKVRIEEAGIVAAAGQQLSFGAQASASAIETSAAPQSGGRTRWREGWLVYRNEPLRAVIDDIARYTDRTIEIADPAAADLRFSGAVYKTDIAEWLSALPESFPVAIETQDTRVVIHTAEVPLSSPASS